MEGLSRRVLSRAFVLKRRASLGELDLEKSLLKEEGLSRRALSREAFSEESLSRRAVAREAF